MSMYHEGHRELQDRFLGRAVADRLEQHRMHRTFTDTDRAFIESVRFSSWRPHGTRASTAP